MRTSKEGPIGCWKSKCRIWCYVYILYFNCRLIWMVLIVDLISEGKHALCNKMNSLYFSGISRTLFLYTILKSRYGLFHTVYTKYLALICSSFFFFFFTFCLSSFFFEQSMTSSLSINQGCTQPYLWTSGFEPWWMESCTHESTTQTMLPLLYHGKLKKWLMGLLSNAEMAIRHLY